MMDAPNFRSADFAYEGRTCEAQLGPDGTVRVQFRGQIVMPGTITEGSLENVNGLLAADEVLFTAAQNAVRSLM